MPRSNCSWFRLGKVWALWDKGQKQEGLHPPHLMGSSSSREAAVQVGRDQGQRWKKAGARKMSLSEQSLSPNSVVIPGIRVTWLRSGSPRCHVNLPIGEREDLCNGSCSHHGSMDPTISRVDRKQFLTGTPIAGASSHFTGRTLFPNGGMAWWFGLRPGLHYRLQ